MDNLQSKKNYGIKAFFPLIVFLIIYLGSGIFFTLMGIEKPFNQVPREAALLGGLVAAIIMGKDKVDFKIDIISKHGGDSGVILMCIIFLLAGAFAGAARGMGGVDATVNLGLSIIPRKFIFSGIFIIAALIATAMGTSMGTISAIGPIAIGLAEKAHISPTIAIAAVLGGAMFGDNMSFISDTTIAATRTQEVAMKDKFKVNFAIVLPAVIINMILISFMGGSGVEGKIYEYNLVNIIPYISIIVLALTGLNVINVLGIGIALGLGIGLFHGSFTFVEIFGILQRGLGWMEDMSIIAIVVGGVVALMNHFGGITYLLENLTARIKSKRGAETGIAVLVSLLDLATTNNTVSIITAGPMAKDIADKFGVDRKRVAGLLDLFSSAFQGLMPYAGQMLMAAGMAQISPASIVPYSWYSMLMIVMGALSIATGLPNFKNSKA